ncbi:MAG: hypothetical protein RLZZ584_3872, partial [Pseudomonadota bacterium]
MSVTPIKPAAGPAITSHPHLHAPAPAPAHDDAGRARVALPALRLLFLTAGALYASWGVEIPAVKAHFGLGEQALSWALLAGGLGTTGAIACAAPALARWGERRVAVLCGVVMAAALGAVLMVKSYAALLALMVLFGVVAGLFDVAINAQASELERRQGRPLMSGLHAWFSLGGLLGAGVGAGLLKLGLSPAHHLLCVGAAGALAVLPGAARMLAHRPAPAPADTGKARPRGALLLLGLLAASGLVAEGAMYDWSVLLLAQARGANPVQAALAFASFSAAMAAGRFGGDALRARWPMVTLLRACGLLAAAGMALTLAPGPLWAALAGCALVG